MKSDRPRAFRMLAQAQQLHERADRLRRNNESASMWDPRRVRRVQRLDTSARLLTLEAFRLAPELKPEPEDLVA